MYDRENELHEFVGDDRAEAVANACQFYGVDEEALSIGELDPSSVSGLGARYVIVAGLRDRKVVRDDGGGGGGRGGPRGRGDDRGPRGGGGGRDRGPRERGDRDRGRGRERGRDRDRGRDRPRDGDRDRDRDRAPRRDAAPERADAEPAREPAEPSEGKVEGSLGEIGQFVLGVMERMGLGGFSIRESQEGNLVIVEVRGGAATDLAERDGRAVDALQLLANQAAMQAAEEDSAPRVVIDMEGNADQREDFLTGVAERVARRACDTGRAVALDPMNGRDRRIIHVALRDHEQVATISRGEGQYRQVVVVPEGAPEYEEARRAAEAAAERE